MAHEARYDFEFPWEVPAKIVKHVMTASRATGKCQLSLSHGPETVENSDDRLPKSRLLLLDNGVRGRRQGFQNHVCC